LIDWFTPPHIYIFYIYSTTLWYRIVADEGVETPKLIRRNEEETVFLFVTFFSLRGGSVTEVLVLVLLYVYIKCHTIPAHNASKLLEEK
jgi:hypothetical protein